MKFFFVYFNIMIIRGERSSNLTFWRWRKNNFSKETKISSSSKMARKKLNDNRTDVFDSCFSQFSINMINKKQTKIPIATNKQTNNIWLWRIQLCCCFKRNESSWQFTFYSLFLALCHVSTLVTSSSPKISLFDKSKLADEKYTAKTNYLTRPLKWLSYRS